MTKPGQDARDQIVHDLWTERHNGTWWTRKPPKRTAPDGFPEVPRDDELTTARRRRELLEAVAHHTDHESEAR